MTHVGMSEIIILAVLGLVCLAVVGGAVAFLLLSGGKDKAERRDD